MNTDISGMTLLLFLGCVIAAGSLGWILGVWYGLDMKLNRHQGERVNQARVH